MDGGSPFESGGIPTQQQPIEINNTTMTENPFSQESDPPTSNNNDKQIQQGESDMNQNMQSPFSIVDNNSVSPVQQPMMQPSPVQQPMMQPSPVQQPMMQPSPVQQPMMQPSPVQQPMMQPMMQAPAPMQQPQGGFQNNNGNRPKYNIIDLFWLTNLKFFKQEQLGQNEAGLLSIGYNADFDNMRCTLRSVTNESFTSSSVIISNTQQVAIMHVYAETCLQILHMIEMKTSGAIHNFERIIQASSKWTPNQSTINVTPEVITIQSTNNQGQVHSFDLSDWQIAAFKKACEFMVNGPAWTSSLNKKTG